MLRGETVPRAFSLSSMILDLDREPEPGQLVLVWESTRAVPGKDVEHLTWARVLRA